MQGAQTKLSPTLRFAHGFQLFYALPVWLGIHGCYNLWK